MINKCDVVIIGAGAAGMMCAIEACLLGRKVVLLDHAPKIGEKISQYLEEGDVVLLVSKQIIINLYLLIQIL